MPTRTQAILCWALFTAAMAALGWALRHVIPPMMGAAYDAVGTRPVLALLFVAWCVFAWFGWGPLVRASLVARAHRRRGGHP